MSLSKSINRSREDWLAEADVQPRQHSPPKVDIRPRQQTPYEVTVHSSLDTIDTNAWDDLLENSKFGSVFLRSGWLRAIEHSYDYEPRYVTVERDGNLFGAFPTFVRPFLKGPFTWLTAPPMGYTAPIISSNEPEVFDLLMDGVKAELGGRTVGQLIQTPLTSHLRYAKKFQRRGYLSNLSTCRVVIDLDRPWNDIFAEMRRHRRRNFQRAYSNDYEIADRALSETALRDFGRRYNVTTERTGADQIPLQFFGNVYETLGDRIKLFTASVDGETVGELVCVLDDEQATVQAVLSAIEQQHFEYYPSELLHGHMIQWGIENGYEQCDFGATAADFENGIFYYKSRYGGRIVPTLTWVYLRGLGDVTSAVWNVL